MKNKIIILLSLLLSAFYSKAADAPKIIIGIIPFNYSESDYKRQAEQLQDMVTRIFNGYNRVSLLDRSKIAAIQKELNLQKGKEYIGGKTVKQNKSFGAQYIIIGNLTNVDVEKTSFGTVTASSKCKISFTLQKIDVTTGEVNATKVFDIGTNGGIETGGYKKETDLFKNAIHINAGKINIEVRDWLITLFPPILKFYKIEQKDKKGLPKYVSVVAGNDSRIQVGDLISVVEVEEFEFEGNLKHRRTEVSVLKAKEIQGDVIKCSVVNGEKVLEEKINGVHPIEIFQKQ